MIALLFMVLFLFPFTFVEESPNTEHTGETLTMSAFTFSE